MGKIIFSPISKHLKLDFSMSHSDERSISEEISPVMFLRENNFEVIVGGFRDVGKENLSIFSSPEGKKLMSFFGHPLCFEPGDFFIGCSITTVCTDSQQ